MHLSRWLVVPTFAGLTLAACLPVTLCKADQLKPNRIEFGTDYYPEDWPSERLEIDAQLMQQARFTAVRVADTNWERMEPQEGRYDFAWLDRVVDVLNRHGMRVILCTSSYVPPAWLIQKHPDFYLVQEDGVRRRWGGMGFICLNNPTYRQYVAKLVTALATHFGHNPGVLGWQIDNEMGGWGYTCYDEDYCTPKFREYLKKKFGTLDELNRRLLTVSYGHSYSSWDQVPLRGQPNDDNQQVPLLLEIKRFFSDNINEFMAFQANLLRQNTSGQLITHNGPDRTLNGFDLAKSLDSLGDDNYPRVGEYIAPAYDVDLFRGFNRGKPFLILEHRSGSFGGYTLGDPTPPPGLCRLWAWQTLAHGADGVLFFRWRMNNGGSEQYWQGLMNYDGTPGRAFPEVRRMAEEVAKISPDLLHATTDASVAEVVSYDSLWALHVGSSSFPYVEQLQAVRNGFRHWGLNVDFVEPTDDLGKYKVVVAPTLHVVSPSIVENLEKFVSGGGVLVLTARSGFKTEDNLATQVPPGPLARLAKVRVPEFTLLESVSQFTSLGFPSEEGTYRASPENVIRSASPDWPGEYKANVWAEVLEPEGARTLFQYQQDHYAGRAAVTVADYGKGKVIYVGTLLEPRFYSELARHACGGAKLGLGPEIPPGVDFVVREGKRQTFNFVLNFSPDPRFVTLPGKYRDLLSDKSFDGQVSVPSLDLRILVRE